MKGGAHLLLLLLVVCAPALAAQEPAARVIVQVRSEAGPVPLARVRAGRRAVLSNAQGEAILTLTPGAYRLSVEKLGFATESLPLVVAAGAEMRVQVHLEEVAIETEGIVVTATRTERRIEDEPIRVEVLTREEVEEKLLMTPGNIAMLLNETAGLRVQTTSASLGGANIRVQGLRGRYTQVLSDGLPLHGAQTGSLGLLQIPPMDLAQVEVIKGAASALYGASALGGVINLVSRHPGDERELLLNATSQSGGDAVLWSSAPLGAQWGYTLLGGAHLQERVDLDGDGWADVPAHRRGAVRPRLFWNDGAGRSVMLTVGGTAEERRGGTLPGMVAPDGAPFREELDTRRVDGGLVGRLLVADRWLLSTRASATRQQHEHLFGVVRERDTHTTRFAEAALSGVVGAHAWVGGLALQQESFRGRDVAGLDYRYLIPSIFAQDEYTLGGWATLAASARADHHSEYGAFLSPRLSLLLRPFAEWNLRLSAGTGYFAPTPFTDETEETGLARLLPLEGVRAEQARTASLDLGGVVRPVELNATLFGSSIEGALALRESATRPGWWEIHNLPGRTLTYGTELLARLTAEPFHLTASHTFLRSREPDREAGGRREVPLTPRHSVGVVGMWEEEGRTRLGIELYYTGRQALEENPYRRVSEPYVILGFLAEQRLGRMRVFLNAENLTDARQTRHDPLVRPRRSAEGRWTTAAWAPLEGRVFNGGVRIEF